MDSKPTNGKPEAVLCKSTACVSTDTKTEKLHDQNNPSYFSATLTSLSAAAAATPTITTTTTRTAIYRTETTR